MEKCNSNCIYLNTQINEGYDTSEQGVKKGNISCFCDLKNKKIASWEDCPYFANEHNKKSVLTYNPDFKLIVFCGKSAVGKDFGMNYLKKEFHIAPMMSYTSRPMRNGERQGVEYNFVSKEELLKMIDNGELLEYRVYHTTLNGIKDDWYYGVHKSELSRANVMVTAFDINGIKEISKYLEPKNLVIIYVDGGLNLREQRAKKRGGFEKIEWDRRVKSDEIALSRDKLRSVKHYYITNEGSPYSYFEKLKEVLKTENIIRKR